MAPLRRHSPGATRAGAAERHRPRWSNWRCRINGGATRTGGAGRPSEGFLCNATALNEDYARVTGAGVRRLREARCAHRVQHRGNDMAFLQIIDLHTNHFDEIEKLE